MPNRFETFLLESNPCNDEKTALSQKVLLIYSDFTKSSENTSYISYNRNTRNIRDKNDNSNTKSIQNNQTNQDLPKKAKTKKIIAVVGESIMKSIYGSAYSDNKNNVFVKSISGAGWKAT